MKYSKEFKETPEYKSILIRNNKWYLDHKEERRKQMKEYRIKNLEKSKEYKRKYYIKNRERILNNRREYRNKNPDKIKSWWIKNPDKSKEYNRSERFKKYRRTYEKERRDKDLEFWLRKTLRRRLNFIIKNKLNNKILPSKTYGIDYSEIAKFIGPCPGERKDWHVDHIIPLSKFNLNDPNEIKKAFAPSNHRWITAKENLMKQDKTIEEFEEYKKRINKLNNTI